MSDLKIARLSNEAMKEINDLEQDIGVNLIAYYVEDNDYANLSDDVVLKIKKLEQKLNIILLAYPHTKSA